jgi:hypothetical protein
LIRGCLRSHECEIPRLKWKWNFGSARLTNIRKHDSACQTDWVR